jgi:hypothetical protein
MFRPFLFSILLPMTIFISAVFSPSVFAADNSTINGWETGSEYNALYNAKELDRLKGTITKFTTVTPLAGMAKGTAFYLDEGDGEKILVHLCPASYASDKKTGLRKGVTTKVRGSWAVIDDEDVFMASKVKQGEHFEFKVRLTKDGTPFWTMSPEQLAQELASN